MKFSVTWLREFVDLPEKPEDLADVLTLAGVEIEAIEPHGADIDHVVAQALLDDLEQQLAPGRRRAGAHDRAQGAGDPALAADDLAHIAFRDFQFDQVAIDLLHEYLVGSVDQ